jgi:hypothetical protein
MKMLPSDKPTRIDQLGFEPYVKGVENLIRQTAPDDLPLTIGIYGAWGSGKTSFMLQLQSRLETNTDGLSLPTIWFDAWKYDRMQDVRSALIYKILFDLQTKADVRTKEKLENAAKNLGRLTAAFIKQSHVHLGAPGGGGVTLPSILEAQEYTRDWRNYQTIIDQFVSEFGKAVEAYLGQCQQKQEAKLVVFIDDLDRCLPENVIVVLEALKLFLVESQCVFIIGVDRTVVESAIQAHYNTDLGGLGSKYLDKIIRYPFNIPPTEPTKLEEYFGQLAQPDSLNDKCLHVLKAAGEGNPRVYLRLVNAWNLVSSLAPHVIPPLWQEAHKHILAIATAVHIRFPALHEVCCNNPSGLYFFVDACFNPPREEINSVFVRSNAVEYTQFWENAPIQHFCRGLKTLEPGGSIEAILGPRELLKSAFNLSASIP